MSSYPGGYKESQAKRKCHLCHFMGTPSELAEHERNTHSTNEGRQAQRAWEQARELAVSRYTGNHLVACSFCQQKIEAVNYGSHLKFFHQDGAANRMSSKNVPRRPNVGGARKKTKGHVESQNTFKPRK